MLPEGYGLVPVPSKDTYYEPLMSNLGTAVCGSSTGATQYPIQNALSCAAKAHTIAIAANLFVSLPNGTRRITEVIFDTDGTTLEVYSKHHLFPSELALFSPGPFQPSVFTLGSVTYGILICYEGFYPDVSGDWSQMTSLKAFNASVFVWSVGDTMGTLPTQAKVIATKFHVDVVGTEDQEGHKADVSIVDPTGRDVPSTDVPVVTPQGYTAQPFVRVATLSL